MALTDVSRSRVITGLKVVLPMTALMILSMLFVMSSPVDPTRAIPYIGIDLDDLARAPQARQASYAGMTDDGAALQMRAATLRSDPDVLNQLVATDLSVVLEPPDAGRTEVHARFGQLDRAAGLLFLQGNVHLRDGSGYQVNTDQLTAALDRSWMASRSPVTATGPAGRLRAGGMELSRPEHEDGYILVFTEGVELLYTPEE